MYVVQCNWEISNAEQQTAKGERRRELCCSSEEIHFPKENIIHDSSESKLYNRFVRTPEEFLGVSCNEMKEFSH